MGRQSHETGQSWVARQRHISGRSGGAERHVSATSANRDWIESHDPNPNPNTNTNPNPNPGLPSLTLTQHA